jgi:hypothetical protein
VCGAGLPTGLPLGLPLPLPLTGLLLGPGQLAAIYGRHASSASCTTCSQPRALPSPPPARLAQGTIIQATRDMSNTLVTSIVLKNNVTLVDVVSTRMLGQYGFLARVFEVFSRNKVSVDMVATSEVGLWGSCGAGRLAAAAAAVDRGVERAPHPPASGACRQLPAVSTAAALASPPAAPNAVASPPNAPPAVNHDHYFCYTAEKIME